MYICKYVYVYMYIYIYVYLYICTYAYMYICIYAYMYICKYVYMYICQCVYININKGDFPKPCQITRKSCYQWDDPPRAPSESPVAGHQVPNKVKC